MSRLVLSTRNQQDVEGSNIKLQGARGGGRKEALATRTQPFKVHMDSWY